MRPPNAPSHNVHGVRSVGVHLAVVAVSGVLLALAFPEPGWGWLAHVALVPMSVLALRSANAKRLAWTSFLVSWVWWCVMIRWMWPVTGGGMIALSAYMALYTPAFLLLIRWFHRRHRAAMVLALPAVWVSLELIRGWFLQGGFGWFNLAHAAAPYHDGGVSRLIQVADVFGEETVSFITAMTNGLIVDLLTRPLRKAGTASGGGRRTSRMIQAAVLLWLVTMAGAWLYGERRIRQTEAAVKPGPLVSVIQTNVPQNNKDTTDATQEARDWARMVELTLDAAKAAAANSGAKPDLIAWPETMVPAALNHEALDHYRMAQPSSGRGEESFDEDISTLAHRLNLSILAGAHAYYDWRAVPSPDGKYEFEAPARPFNAAFLYRADGTQDDSIYMKVHLVPFGEYIPWVNSSPTLKDLFIKYLSPYPFDYTLRAGVGYTVFTLPAAQGAKPVRLATPICFEDTISRATHRMCYADGRKRADLLINLTNDGWFTGPLMGEGTWLGRTWMVASYQPPQQLQAATLRCVENRVSMARSVNTGISGFIDSAGRVGPLLKRNIDGSATARMMIDGRTTLYGRVGAWPVIALAILTGLLAVVGVWRKNEKHP